MQSTRLSLTNRLLCSGVIVLLMLLGSCGVVPKNAPVGKPFVFKYTVTVDGNFSPAEKSNLETRLARQLDDSIRVRTVRKLIYKGVNRPVLDKPPVYDPSNAERSKVFMRALLVSLGYFKDTITDNAVFDTISAEEIRTTVNFIVKPGNAVTIDSFRYNLSDSNLQKLAVSTQGQALIKKGEAFAKTSISSELDRLVELYRNNGYMKFGREELYGLWDTLDVSLLKPVTDPFEQLELLQKLQARKDSLKANLEIRLRPNADTVKLRQYKVGNIYLFPEHTPLEARGKFVQVAPGVFVDTVQRVFVPKIFPPYLYLKTGDIYDQRNFVRTINRFNQLGSWRMVAIDQNIRSGTDTSDFSIRLTPAKKYSFTANLEGSRNENAVSGNLFGIGVNFSLQNRNFARRANIANTSIRVGVETGRDKAAGINFIQTKQLSATHTIYFPRAIFPYNKIFNAGTQATSRTVLSLSGALTERRALYNLNTANLAYGIDFRWGTTDMSIRWPNVEYSSFTSQPRLDTIFSRNPSLRNVFTDGLIVSAKVGAVHNEIRDKRVSVIRGNLEISGIPGLRNNFFDTNLYRFVKLDAEYIQKTKLGKNDLVFRFLPAWGMNLHLQWHPLKNITCHSSGNILRVVPTACVHGV